MVDLPEAHGYEESDDGGCDQSVDVRLAKERVQRLQEERGVKISVKVYGTRYTVAGVRCQLSGLRMKNSIIVLSK